ncbi:MAG TPA: ABC transporter permease [Candidatus Dormibacteraeota bacterium]|nr:ABC transporter permease [Candidatus Dormibacteraeota bacterium]
MTRYLVWRVGQAIPTLFLISLALFFGMHALPGGPMAAFAFSPRMSQAAKNAIIKAWGLNQPLYVQYFVWAKSMVTGNWEFSFFLGIPVRKAIAEHLPATVILMGTAFCIQELLALPSGIYAALRRYSIFDQAVTFFSYIFFSMPTFWLGLMLILALAVFVPIFPVAGIVNVSDTGAGWGTPQFQSYLAANPVSGVLDIIHHLILPAFTVALVGIAGDSRFMRASMMDTVNQDYVRTARAKGLLERTVVLKHALRNALLPVITNIALTLPVLFGGAVVTEQIFSWPGMGQLFYQALSVEDYTLLMGIMFVSSVLIVFCNILADIAYAIVDPRISYA